MIRNKTKATRLAFTLLEVIVVVGILGLLAGVVIYSFKDRTGRNDTASVAKVVHDLLVLSRSRAAALDEPAGIVFPGNSTVYAQSCTRVSSRGLVAVDGQVNWSQESGLVYLSWGTVASETLTPRLVYKAYDLSTISGISSTDPVLMFTPSGEVLARGIAFDGTYYHLRVGNQPSGDSLTLTGMKQVWDIKIDIQGNVILERDLDFPAGSGGLTPTINLPPAPPGLPPSNPVVLSVSPSEDLADTGVGLAFTTPNETVQLVAQASSPSGSTLFVRWSSDGGRFSDGPDWIPMTYSSDDNRWKSSISWSLPASPGATQTVNVEVRDRFNNTSVSTPASRVVFDTNPRVNAKLFFVSRPNSSTESSIETVNGDGSGRRVLVKDLPSGPLLAASPSGEFLAWIGDGVINNNQLAISDTEGRILQVVTLPRSLSYDLAWSDDSRRVIVNDGGVSPTTMWSVNPTDGSFTTLITFAERVDRPSISGDLQKICYTKPASDHILYCYDRSAGTETAIYTGPTPSARVGSYHISRAGNYCGFIVSQSYPSNSVIAATDGSSSVDLGKGSQPTISPDESTVIFISRETSTQVVVSRIDGTQLHAHPSFNGANATERQHVFTPDSRHAVFQAGVWFDHRFMAIDVASGDELELLGSDGLNNFSPQAVSVR